MRIKYTPRALTDIDAAFTFIAETDPAAARRVVARVEDTIALLAQMPFIGRKRANRPDHIRAFSVRPYPFLIVYAIQPDAIEILSLWHTSRDPNTQP